MKNLLALLAATFLAACAGGPDTRIERAEGLKALPAQAGVAEADVRFLNRLTFGATAASAKELAGLGRAKWLERQLAPPAGDDLPPEAAEVVAGLTIATRPLEPTVVELAKRRRAFQDQSARPSAPLDRAAEQRFYQQEITRLAREAGTRSLLRALYSPWQLREQMTWFWMNHFSVFGGKAELRALVGDYEERAIRPHALGRFRDLLGAVARHPAMLRYLDNAQNASGRLNENYARELMELHTLGVDAGYTQADVQELSRVLTGHGVNFTGEDRQVRPAVKAEYVRAGLYEFVPGRHDYGAKTLLGEPVRTRGAAELDEALDRLSRHPATARFVSRRLAQHFVADAPPPELVERMAAAWRASGGDIAQVLRAMLAHPAFEASLGGKFKDPHQYVVSAVRLAYEERTILNAAPMLGWLQRLGQMPWSRQTPDGWPLTRAEWSSAGQMAARFEVARAIGYGAAGLFRTEGPDATERPGFPQLANALYYGSMQKTLGASTRKALESAGSPQEWNLLFLSSPEFMSR